MNFHLHSFFRFSRASFHLIIQIRPFNLYNFNREHVLDRILVFFFFRHLYSRKAYPERGWGWDLYASFILTTTHPVPFWQDRGVSRGHEYLFFGFVNWNNTGKSSRYGLRSRWSPPRGDRARNSPGYTPTRKVIDFATISLWCHRICSKVFQSLYMLMLKCEMLP